MLKISKMGFARHLAAQRQFSRVQSEPLALLFLSLVTAAKTLISVMGVGRAVGVPANGETLWVTKPQNYSPKYPLTCAPHSDGCIFDFLHQVSHG